MAAGVPFLGFTPPRPLRVFYLQAELQYHYLRERLHQIGLPSEVLVAARDGFVGTDTASCAEEYTDIPVTWVRGEETNFKITYAQDLLLAQDVVSALGLRSS